MNLYCLVICFIVNCCVAISNSTDRELRVIDSKSTDIWENFKVETIKVETQKKSLNKIPFKIEF